jgi:hypothetical protein
VFFIHTSIAYTKLHEEIFKLYLGWVFKTSYSHGINPKRESLIQMLSLSQAMVQEADAHLQDDGAIWLVRKQLFQHVNQSIMHLLRIQLQKLVHVKLFQTLYQMLSRLCILFKDE